MTTAQTPFEAMLAQAQATAGAFAPAMASLDAKALAAIWPTMPKDVMEATFGRGLSKDGLDAKTRLLLTLAGLTMQGASAETQLRLTLRHASEAGATPDEITQTIGLMAMFAGLPASTRANEIAQDVLNAQKATNTTGAAAATAKEDT